MRVFWLAYGEYNGRRELRPFKRYVESKLKQYNDDLTYRFYIAESIYQYTHGRRLNSSFQSIIRPQKQDDRDGDEIALDVINKCGLSLNKKEMKDECI